jgi:hypothetical protein
MTANYNELARMHHKSEDKLDKLQNDMQLIKSDMKIMNCLLMSQSNKRMKIEEDYDDATIEENQSQTEEVPETTEVIVAPWETLVHQISSIKLDVYLYHWIDSNAEQSYANYNEKTGPARTKYSRLLGIYEHLTNFKQESDDSTFDYRKKPTDRKELLTWKGQLQLFSNACFTNGVNTLLKHNLDYPTSHSKWSTECNKLKIKLLQNHNTAESS